MIGLIFAAIVCSPPRRVPPADISLVCTGLNISDSINVRSWNPPTPPGWPPMWVASYRVDTRCTPVVVRGVPVQGAFRCLLGGTNVHSLIQTSAWSLTTQTQTPWLSEANLSCVELGAGGSGGCPSCMWPTATPNAPNAPTGLTTATTLVGTPGVRLTWAESVPPVASGYIIERKLPTDQAWVEVGRAMPSFHTGFDVGGAAATLYNWRVRAFNDGGTSGPSTAIAAATGVCITNCAAPNPPSGLTATASGGPDCP